MVPGHEHRAARARRRGRRPALPGVRGDARRAALALGDPAARGDSELLLEVLGALFVRDDPPVSGTVRYLGVLARELDSVLGAHQFCGTKFQIHTMIVDTSPFLEL